MTSNECNIIQKNLVTSTEICFLLRRNQVSRVSQEREDREGALDLM